MADPFIGQIQSFGFTFNPRGWANCDGQLLPIAQHTALFSLYGTTYGGDGRQTFALPDLRGRVPISAGRGAGLPVYKEGERAGATEVTLSEQQVPPHKHPFAQPCNTDDGRSDEPQNQFPAKAAGGETLYAATSDASMGGGTTGASGKPGPHNNMQPYQVIRFCCALEGMYPSRS